MIVIPVALGVYFNWIRWVRRMACDWPILEMPTAIDLAGDRGLDAPFSCGQHRSWQESTERLEVVCASRSQPRRVASVPVLGLPVFLQLPRSDKHALLSIFRPFAFTLLVSRRATRKRRRICCAVYAPGASCACGWPISRDIRHCPIEIEIGGGGSLPAEILAHAR